MGPAVIPFQAAKQITYYLSDATGNQAKTGTYLWRQQVVLATNTTTSAFIAENVQSLTIQVTATMFPHPAGVRAGPASRGSAGPGEVHEPVLVDRRVPERRHAHLRIESRESRVTAGAEHGLPRAQSRGVARGRGSSMRSFCNAALSTTLAAVLRKSAPSSIPGLPPAVGFHVFPAQRLRQPLAERSRLS